MSRNGYLFQLGDRVTVSAKAVRSFDEERKLIFWQQEPLPEPVSGIIVGARVRFTGKKRWDEYQRYFEPTGSVRVYLIAFAMHENPMLAFAGNIKRVEETEQQ